MRKKEGELFRVRSLWKQRSSRRVQRRLADQHMALILKKLLPDSSIPFEYHELITNSDF